MNEEKLIENALKFHEEHLFFNPKTEHNLIRVMKLKGVMRIKEVRKLLEMSKIQGKKKELEFLKKFSGENIELIGTQKNPTPTLTKRINQFQKEIEEYEHRYRN